MASKSRRRLIPREFSNKTGATRFARVFLHNQDPK
jgi:hypothetical protein